MFVLGTVVYTHSHLCKSMIYRQIGCQLANNYQAGTVDSRVDRNEKGIKPETYQGYRNKVFWKTTENLERIRHPQSFMENAINRIPR
jgi:hypothetical protein